MRFHTRLRIIWPLIDGTMSVSWTTPPLPSQGGEGYRCDGGMLLVASRSSPKALTTPYSQWVEVWTTRGPVSWRSEIWDIRAKPRLGGVGLVGRCYYYFFLNLHCSWTKCGSSPTWSFRTLWQRFFTKVYICDTIVGHIHRLWLTYDAQTGWSLGLSHEVLFQEAYTRSFWQLNVSLIVKIWCRLYS